MFFPCLVEKLSHPARLPDLCFSLCHSFGVSSQLGLCVLFFQCQFVFVASRQYSVNLSVFFCCFICIWLFLFYHFFSVKGCFWGLKPTKSKKYLNGSWCTLKSQHLLIYKMWRKWTVLLSFASVLIYFWVHYLFIFPSNFPLCFFFY